MADKSGQQDSPTEKRVQRRTRALRDACERRRNSRAFFWGGSKGASHRQKQAAARCQSRGPGQPRPGGWTVCGAWSGGEKACTWTGENSARGGAGEGTGAQEKNTCKPADRQRAILADGRGAVRPRTGARGAHGSRMLQAQQPQGTHEKGPGVNKSRANARCFVFIGEVVVSPRFALQASGWKPPAGRKRLRKEAAAERRTVAGRGVRRAARSTRR